MASFNLDRVRSLQRERKRWEDTTLKQTISRLPERGNDEDFTTVSGMPVNRLYTPADIPDFDYERDLGLPGEYPFTRGVHANMYRAKPWTMRLFAGFGTAEETNARFKYLLEHGETGLSIAYDFPTLYGRDSDDPLSEGEVGTCGVAMSSLEDMEILLDGLPLDKITTSMTINGPAPIVWAMYIAAAEKKGFPRHILGGTTQNDILKEYIAQNTYIYPPEPSLKLVVDTMEFGTKEMPRWNTISISGYHIREAGATALQELAFTLIDGLTYVEEGIKRGMSVDDFAPRLSFFFNCHNDFFEEIAKFRAARRIWARELKETYGAKNPRSWLLRFHTQTAGCSLTAQQPEINIVRTAIQAMAAVLGGTQSLHTNSMDEALALPSDKAVKIALRTQQIIAHESGVTNSVDPLGGSYMVEALTNEMERGFYDYKRKIDALGGMLPAINQGYPMKEIADASFRFQEEMDSKRRIMVGANEYVEDEPLSIPILAIDPKGYERQCQRLARLRLERDNAKTSEALEKLRVQAVLGRENMMPHLIDCCNAYATLGEIAGVLRKVYGEHRDPSIV
ncbi:MAG: methylmalonyl-CoA mutase family protein [Chloroflexi bacterium]|nr:methylmalonyl-CoA mutase family protein [Chloroflexota bacterium]OJW02100.1 MAG: methylmalonyl-CoA mutase [Chloroflexi bacterium 54-19]